jgi:hypothetical protein
LPTPCDREGIAVLARQASRIGQRGRPESKISAASIGKNFSSNPLVGIPPLTRRSGSPSVRMHSAIRLESRFQATTTNRSGWLARTFGVSLI